MKKILISIIFLTTILITVGCGAQDDVIGNGDIYIDKEWDMYEEGHQVKKAESINFWSANSATDAHGSVMADLVEEFNRYQQETYPQSPIKVNISFQGGYSNQNAKLQASLMGGTNPEIAMVGVSSLALYVNNTIDMRRIYTYDQIRNIQEGLLQFAMYKHKFSGYPYFASTNLYLTNRTLLESTGMKIPTVDEIVSSPDDSIWTWDYFEEVIAAVRDVENEVYGAAISELPIYESFYTQGIAPYNEECNKSNINNDQGLKMLSYWQNIAKNDLIKNPMADPNHGTKIQGEFVSGDVGLMFSTSSIIKNMYDMIVTNNENAGLDPTFDFDVLPHPKETNFYSNQSGGALTIFNNKNSSKTNAAIEFLRWLSADEQVVKFSSSTGYLPCTKSSLELESWKEFTEQNDLLDKAVKLLQFSTPEGTKLPIGRAKSLADNEFSLYSKGIFMDNFTRTPASVLKSIIQRIDYVLDTNS